MDLCLDPRINVVYFQFPRRIVFHFYIPEILQMITQAGILTGKVFQADQFFHDSIDGQARN